MLQYVLQILQLPSMAYNQLYRPNITDLTPYLPYDANLTQLAPIGQSTNAALCTFAE